MGVRSREERREESTPLLGGVPYQTGQDAAQTSNGHDNYGSTPLTTAEEEAALTAHAEAIKKALPLRMVLISIACLCSCLLTVAIDGTLLVTLLNDISTVFSASDLVFWLGTSYTLAMCAVSPIYGRLNDIVGRKNALLCAVSIFLLGTTLCALAPSMMMLIAARTIAGMGGGGISTCVAVVIGDLIPLERRGLYQAIGQVVFSIGNAAGGPVGGYLSDSLGWRWAIGSQIPILGLALFLLIFFFRLPEFPVSKQEQERRAAEAGRPLYMVVLRRLDLTGSALLVMACLTLMLGLSFLSSADLPLSHVKVWGNFIAAFLSTLLFIYVELYVAREPVLPMSLLRNRTIASASAIYFLICFATALFFYFPVYFRSVLLQSATQAGTHFLPATIATTAGSIVSGAMLHRTGRYREMLLVYSLISLTSPLSLSTWSTTNKPSAWAQNLVLVPTGFASAAISTTLTVSVIAASHREAQAVTIGLLYLSRSLGTIVGVSTLGALLQSSLASELSRRITGKHAVERIDKIRKNANIVNVLPPAQQKAAMQSYAAALRIMNICIAVVIFFGLLTSLFVKSHRIEKRNIASADEPEASSTIDPEN